MTVAIVVDISARSSLCVRTELNGVTWGTRLLLCRLGLSLSPGNCTWIVHGG
jgi:hypothetical protein